MAELGSTLGDFTRRTLIVAAILLAAAGGVLLLMSASQVFFIVFAGVLLAILLRAIANAVARRTGLPEKLALALATVGLAAALVGTGLALWPSLSDQIDELAEQLPRAWDRLADSVRSTPLGEHALDRLSQDAPGMRDLLGRAAGWLATMMGAIGTTVVMLFVGLYLAAEPGLYRRGLIKLAPVRCRARAGEVVDAAVVTLRWWMLGTFISMVVVGVMTVIGLWAIGMPLALTLGIIAGVLAFVPTFGPIVAAVPAVLLALVISPWMALWVVLLYLGIQTVESYVITPYVQRETVRTPQALLIVAQVLMGLIAGALGLIFATPLAAVVLVVVRMLYVEDVLGDRPADQSGSCFGMPGRRG